AAPRPNPRAARPRGARAGATRTPGATARTPGTAALPAPGATPHATHASHASPAPHASRTPGTPRPRPRTPRASGVRSHRDAVRGLRKRAR
ncbi:hypothetical protein ACFV00_34265, partial [Streptomyces californicus]